MSTNPLFPPDSDSTGPTEKNAAVELVRSKVAQAFQQEPAATEELAELKKPPRTPSKHQQFMQELVASGKSLAEIQTAWHHYYVTLSDSEKREVWQEFYEANQHTPYQKLFQKQTPVASKRAVEPAAQPAVVPPAPAPAESTPSPSGAVISTHTLPPETTTTGRKQAVRKLKTQIAHRVSAGGRLKAKHHVQSLLVGLGTGFAVLAILLFSFFNEYIIAPFIQPSRHVSATPIILGDGANLDTSVAQVIIPKINVQIPLDFSVATNDENAIENALEGGVVHYPSTVLPGQAGNSAFFGHSSNNIFNPGKYKFAFVLLHTLTTGDIFYITYNGTAYAYQVFDREIVPPSQVSVLNDSKGKPATVTLITCDPPGTSNNRLVVWGEQISPHVDTSMAVAPATPAVAAPTELASNGPSLWSRFGGAREFWN
jgi:LPXTG-site transpeptidase (sortase) family protein